VGYKGALCIEREVENREERMRDIRAAAAMLERLRM